jgi:hypothetical protein
MPMAGNSSGNPAPPWALPVAIVIVVLFIGFVAWKSFGRSDPASSAPPMQVKPDQFDIKKASLEGTLGHPATAPH